MTRTEMLTFIRENPFVKITHRLFSKDEYIYGNGIHIYEEHGYLFDEGILMRSGGLWETGWSLYEEKPTKQTKHTSWENNRNKLQKGRLLKW